MKKPRLFKSEHFVRNIMLLFVIGMLTGLYAYILTHGLTIISSDALTSLVDANAALIGFLAVVLIYLLGTYREDIHSLKTDRRQVIESYESNLRTWIYHPTYEVNIETEEQHNAKLQQFTDDLKKARNRMKTGCFGMLLSALCYTFSILFSLLALSDVSSLNGNPVAATYLANFSTYLGVLFAASGLMVEFIVIWDMMRQEYNSPD